MWVARALALPICLRKQGRIIAKTVAVYSESLIESEFFGHEGFFLLGLTRTQYWKIGSRHGVLLYF